MIVKISWLSFRGLGMARTPSGLISIPGADLGEEVECELVPGPRGKLFGVITKVLHPSTNRRASICRQAEFCSGCQFQHLTYERGLNLKCQALQKTLTRMLGIDASVVKQPIAHLQPNGYRLRARYSILKAEKGWVPGMRPWPGHAFAADMRDCPLHHPFLVKGISISFDILQQAAILDEVEMIEVSAGTAGHVNFKVTAKTSGAIEKIAHALTAAARSHPSYSFMVSDRRGWSPIFAGNAASTIGILGRNFTAGARAWTPVSVISEEMLIRVVNSMIPDTRPRIVEIGAGIGCITSFLRDRAARVIAVDNNRSALENLRENLAAEQREPLVATQLGDADRALLRLLKRGERADAAVFHAVRKPFGRGIARYLPALGVEHLIYIAPSVMSMAKDLIELHAVGYQLREIQPLDQLPFTYHLMSVARLERKKFGG